MRLALKESKEQLMKMIIEGDDDFIDNMHKLSFSQFSNTSKRSGTPKSDDGYLQLPAKV